jgi:hypothetical protein
MSWDCEVCGGIKPCSCVSKPSIRDIFKPRTLLAKWLDPLCWDGCKSLVFKKERDEARRQRDEMAAGFAASEKIIDAISITGHLSKSMLEGESPVGWVKRMISERDEAIERASIFESAATKALNERDEAKVLLSLIRERLCVLQSERNDSVPLDGLANIAIKRLQWRTEERDEAKECLREAMRAIEGISAMPDPIKPEVLNRWNKVAN